MKPISFGCYTSERDNKNSPENVNNKQKVACEMNERLCCVEK